MDAPTFPAAITTFQTRLAGVGDGAWDHPTPCAEWSVRDVVNHVVAELLWVPPLLEGKTIAEVGDQFDGDVLGADPAAAFGAAAAGASAAAAEPGARETTVHLSFGDFPGAEYLGQLTADLTIHAWDVARATAGDERLDEGLVAAVHDFLAPQVEAWRSAGAFGLAADVPDGADLQTTLLALTGRGRRVTGASSAGSQRRCCDADGRPPIRAGEKHA